MISNLSLRSNMIEDISPSPVPRDAMPHVAPLARISARDLNELCELRPGWVKYFDKRNLDSAFPADGLPTQEQREQWVRYFFHGDETVSTKDGQRLSLSWTEMANTLLDRWTEIEPRLNEELAVECMCVLEAAKNYNGDWFKIQAKLIKEKIMKFIEEFMRVRGTDDSGLKSQVHRILGFSDW